MLPPRLRPPAWKGPIPCPKLLLVEGNDEACFFHALSSVLGLDEEIFILDFGGKDNLGPYLRLLVKTPDYGLDRVGAIGIVRDAEDDAAAAFQSVCGALARVGLDVPAQPLIRTIGKPVVSVFILPDCESAGTIETLCLQCAREPRALPCVEQYFECLRGKGIHPAHNIARAAKAASRVYLASRKEPGKSCGHASYEDDCWDWESPALDLLKPFLTSL